MIARTLSNISAFLESKRGSLFSARTCSAASGATAFFCASLAARRLDGQAYKSGLALLLVSILFTAAFLSALGTWLDLRRDS